MKTLINKANPQIRIIAPEIESSYGKFYTLPDKDFHHLFKMETWTLVEEEPEVELEQAAEEYALSLSIGQMTGKEYCKQDFKAGAEWQKQKPVLEVFGFKVGDAVRLKDGDGRKHIIKSFEEVEGIHGPNFYHVEFEDNSARDGIYLGEEYPNGYHTQMEKFEEEPVKEEICSKCIHHKKNDDCYYPYGGMQRRINENGVYECKGFCEKEQAQTEVDLENEAVAFCFDNGINVTPRQATRFARHFYKLGLNARKEE